MIPPFFPDQAQPYISESEARSLFQRLDGIFRKTGSPYFPLMIFPFIVLIIAIIWSLSETSWSFGIAVVTAVIFPILFFGGIAIIMILGAKRKREVTEVIEQWHRTEGVCS